MSADRITIIGHRGSGAGTHPIGGRENSLRSARHAFDSGADEIEVDLAITSDDRIVLYHDPVLSQSRRAVEHVPFADVCAEETEMATLEDLRSAFPTRSLIVELKSYTPYRRIVDALMQTDVSNVRFISFSRAALEYVRSRHPSVYCNFIATCVDERFEPLVRRAHLDWAAEWKIQEISGHWWLFTTTMIRRAREQFVVGLGMIDTPSRLQKCRRHGVTRVYTNRVREVVSWMR